MHDDAGAHDATDLGAWRDTARGSQPAWEARAQAISHFIRPTDVVLDLGAGDQKLRKYLPASCEYLPVDCVNERPNTFVVDFNTAFRLPDRDFNVVVAAGFLEYIADLARFMELLTSASPGRLFLFTYHYTPRDRAKRTHAFRKLNALSDAHECRAFFGKYVDDLHEVLSFWDQGLFAGTLSRDARARTLSLPTINNVMLAAQKKPRLRWWPRKFGRLRRAAAERHLTATARAVQRERLTYLSSKRLRRLESTVSATLVRETPGDILEFGVALGGSAIVLAQHARRHGRAFHGFDVFGMIPPPTSDKDDAKSKNRYEVIASGQSKGIGGDTYYGYRQNLFDEVMASFARHGIPVDGNTIALHRGLFQETWADFRAHAVAFAHVDCDWHDPVKFCLEQLAKRVSPGGVIILDDYHDYGGCRTATDEFLLAHREFRMEDGVTMLLRRT
jgi:O-methyltransferase